jgi:hypothetical protein
MSPKISTALDVRIGMKIGLNLSDIDASAFGETIDYKPKIGYCAGGFYTINIIKEFAIQPEILFSTKGAKTTYTRWGSIYHSSLNFSYLEIPILAKFTMPTLSDFKPFIIAGPSIAIKLSSKEKVKGERSSWKEDIDSLKVVDFGLIFGAGFDLVQMITVDVRYNLGLTNTIKNMAEESNFKNRVFSVTVGFSFNLMTE